LGLVAFSLELSIRRANLISDIFVHSSLNGQKFAILKRAREIGPSHESGFHLILGLPADKDAAF
jgi:hypothetical protein